MGLIKAAIAFALAPTVLAGCTTHAVQSAETSTAVASTTTTTTAAPPTTPAVETKKWVDLDVGDCLADSPPTDPSVVIVTVVDCAAAHQAEVYSRKPLALNSALAEIANHECADGFSQYTGVAIDGSPFAVTFLIDSDQDRTSNNPDPSTVICLLQAANGQALTESARH